LSTTTIAIIGGVAAAGVVGGLAVAARCPARDRRSAAEAHRVTKPRVTKPRVTKPRVTKQRLTLRMVTIVTTALLAAGAITAARLAFAELLARRDTPDSLRGRRSSLRTRLISNVSPTSIRIMRTSLSGARST